MNARAGFLQREGPRISMKVLVVDDEAVSRMALADLAQAALGRAPIEAPDGRAAWARLDGGEAVGLVITDIRMPHINGLDLVAKLRADRRFEHLPVMLVSTANDRHTVESAIQAGVQGFVLKPVTHGAVQRVREVVAQFCASLLQPNPDALARLGADGVRFDSYLSAMIEQGHTLADRLAAVLKGARDVPLNDLVSAVQLQRAVATTLGAQRVVPALSWLEQGIKELTPSGGGELGRALAGYRLQLYWLQAAGAAFQSSEL